VKRPITTAGAPSAIGPYSQAVISGNLLFCSGQVALDPATGQLVEGDAAAQTERVLDNLGAVLEAAGSDFSRVVKTTIYLVDMADFARVNEVYARRFPADPPARATVEVRGLPRGARVEIDAIATVGPQ
jgi:2-iminobutanoate/2-iminopropanoate deaminase